jgi:hypothetical protein
MDSIDLFSLIARLRRQFPRSLDVVEACEELERLSRDAGSATLQTKNNETLHVVETLHECPKCERAKQKAAARLAKHRAGRAPGARG